MKRLVTRIASIIIAGTATMVSLAQPAARVNEYIAQRFRDYCANVPREEAYLHTDRDSYISGEPVWFAAYLFNRQTSSLEKGNTTLYVEVLNSSSVPVIQKKIAVSDGTGKGTIFLPDTLSSGNYLIRSYTNWMKNFLPANCFMKRIFIYNPVNNKFLQGAPGTGDSKQEVQALRPQSKGFGFVVDRRPDSLVITVTADESFRMGNGSTCYLFIDTRGNINYNEPVSLYGTTTRIALSSKILPQGINHITLFSGSGTPVYERFVYSPINGDQEMTVTIPEKVKKREKFSAIIGARGGITSQLSISVSAYDGVTSRSGLADYMVFGSEFGKLPSTIAGRSLNTVSASDINQFLETARSNWTNWIDILPGKMPEAGYRRENEYQNLSGTLLGKESMKPDSGKYVILSKPGKTAWFQYSKTDSKGHFSFDIPSALDGSDIVIQPGETESKDAIHIDSQYPAVYFPPVKETVTQASVPAFLNAWSVNYQASRIYGTKLTGDSIRNEQPKASISRFYGKPDQILMIDNYIKLPVMQEVFFELIPGVYLKNKKSEWDITVADPVDFTIYTSPPVLMIDGVVVHEPAMIANLDPEIVERIEIVRERYMIGDYLMYGIVNVITRKGNFSCVELPDQDIRIAWKNGGSGFSFPAVPVKGQSGRVPDLRTTLFWTPSLKAGNDGTANINLQGSDYSSKYVISIQGVNSLGQPISEEKIFSVVR